VQGILRAAGRVCISGPMTYLIGFLIWLVVAVAAAFLLRLFYGAPATSLGLTLFFAISGAAIGGMLGVSPYVTHDPSPLRFGGLVGAVLGALLFPWMYHVVARKAL
jgi:uncharacterized membrane protein YeaQ/YmgE (transglycosylase-associated protein family)